MVLFHSPWNKQASMAACGVAEGTLNLVQVPAVVFYPISIKFPNRTNYSGLFLLPEQVHIYNISSRVIKKVIKMYTGNVESKTFLVLYAMIKKQW